jgi:hypothetical protein
VREEQRRYTDDTGRLFGYPSDVEVDAVIRNGQHVLVEIKSAVSAFDVAGFARKADYLQRSDLVEFPLQTGGAIS